MLGETMCGIPDWAWILIIVIGVVGGICTVIAQSDLKKQANRWLDKKKVLRSGQANANEWEDWISEGEQLATKCDSIGVNKSDTREFERLAQRIRDDIRAYEAARATAAAHSTTPQAPTITELARLRADGAITEDEFRAFAARFEASPGEKAQEIIVAIGKLHEQRQAGAMTEGNYHASLWTLMDRLEREGS